MATTDKPRGHASVRAALIGAASRLFAERGVKAVSVREIARAASVNHGLVHRHFGSKANLLQEVMQSLSAEVATEMGSPRSGERLDEILAGALSATTARGLHWRILARALLDGEDPATLQAEYPVVRRMLDAARQEPSASLSAEARVTILLALTLGMLLFSPYLQRATGQDDAQWEQVRAEITRFALQSLALR